MAIPPLNSNFRAFLKLLNSHGVKYLLIGGYAVNVHGYYRNTGDLDVWVSVSPENLKRLAAAANEFGWPTKSDSYLNFGEMMQMGVRPYCIEVLTDISAVEFDPCYRNRVHVKIDPELTISVINIEDLRKNKTAAGRLKDLADAEKLGRQQEITNRKKDEKKQKRQRKK